jgi:hypothetical protein
MALRTFALLALIELPYYDDMKLARLNGWDLRNDQDEPWPWPDLTPPLDFVRKQNFKAFVLAKEVWLNCQGFKPDRDFKRRVRFKPKPEPERLRPAFKSWIELTVKDD